MFHGKGIFVVAGIVIVALIVGGVVIFMRSRTADDGGIPSDGLPGTGDLPPFGTPQPPPIGFPQTPPPPQNPADRAVQRGTSVFTSLPSKGKQAIAGFVVGAETGYIVQPSMVNPSAISGELAEQFSQQVESLPPGLKELFDKPGGPTKEDILEVEQKARADYDALTAEINQFHESFESKSNASNTEQCNKIIADVKAFATLWGGGASPSPFGQTTTGCVTQLPFGFPGL